MVLHLCFELWMLGMIVKIHNNQLQRENLIEFNPVSKQKRQVVLNKKSYYVVKSIEAKMCKNVYRVSFRYRNLDVKIYLYQLYTSMRKNIKLVYFY